MRSAVAGFHIQALDEGYLIDAAPDSYGLSAAGRWAASDLDTALAILRRQIEEAQG